MVVVLDELPQHVRALLRRPLQNQVFGVREQTEEVVGVHTARAIVAKGGHLAFVEVGECGLQHFHAGQVELDDAAARLREGLAEQCLEVGAVRRQGLCLNL